MEILTHNFKLMKKWETILNVFSSNIKLFLFSANKSLKWDDLCHEHDNYHLVMCINVKKNYNKMSTN
jgi:hypothetical protein